MTEQETVEFVREGIALFNARDIDRYVQRIDESYVGESETVKGGLRGPEGVRQQLETALAAFPDLCLEIEQILVSGDHVVTRSRATGTHKGSYAGIAPTNNTVTWGLCSVSEIRDRKVIRGRLYGDNASLFQQIGAFSLPRATAAG